MPESYIFGAGKTKELSNLLEKYNSQKVFLITGKDSYVKSGAKFHLDKILSGKQVLRYSEFSQNPKIKDLFKGAEEFRSFLPDMIIAIGGGSVIDTAKLLSVLPADKSKLEKIIKANLPVPERKIPFIAIPTTAGSGSEATHFAVVYQGLTKHSVCSNSLLPDYSILDPELTYSLSPELTAISAFDAFSQAIESYWAVGSTTESRQYAAESIKSILSIYNKLINSPDKETRSVMLKAAHLSGKAINISKTTGPHALSYPLTAGFNIPHGYAVILTLPAFFLYNANAPKEKMSNGLVYDEHQKRIKELCALLDSLDPQRAAKKIKSMVEKAGFLTKLSDLGIKDKDDLKVIIDNVNIERLGNNPVRVDREYLRGLCGE